MQKSEAKMRKTDAVSILRKKLQKYFSVFYCLLFLAFFALPSEAALNIPLTVQEALPAGVAGVDRTNENFTVGIPLTEDSGITNVSQLGLSNAVAAQFRALAWWPNGNIKWVLVDAQTSLTAGGTDTTKALTSGSGNFGGNNLATDNGATITVLTGAATFTVQKTNFNIFDSVAVGGTQLVAPGNNGRLRAIGKDDIEYSSSNDTSSTAVIEENGPVRAVIKATGSFKSSSGVRLMDYTLRLHFFKNKTTVKGNVELRNASKTNAYLTRDFKSVEAIVPVSLDITKTVSFAKNGAYQTYALPAAATAFLFQGFTDVLTYYIPQYHFVGQGYWWDPPLPGSGSDTYTYDPNYTGLKIAIGNTTVNAFGNNQDWSDGVASIQDGSGKGVTVAYRALPGFWPGGFEFKDSGDISIELYSKQNVKTMKLGFGMHDSREIMWDFHTSAGNNQSIHYAMEYPLLARASLTHYMQSKAIYGQGDFVTPAEQISFFNTLNRSSYPVPTTSPSLTNIGRYVFRGWPWSEGGGWNQNNAAGNDLLDYLRTGYGGFFLKAEQRIRMISDTALGRSDDYGVEAVSVNTEGQMWPKLLSSGGADGEHAYLYSLPLYYYMSGNESAKDAWLDYGDRLLRNNSITPYYQLPDTPWLRALSNTIRNSALVYEFSCEVGSCENRLKTALEGAVAYQLDSRDKPVYGLSGRGRNLDRGYLYWDTDVQFNGTQKRLVHSIYHNHIHFEAMYQLWRVMRDPGWNYSRLLELEDYLTGLSKFYLDEWIETPPADHFLAKPPFNFKYAQHYDLLLDEVIPYTGQGDLVPYSFGRAAVWAYQHTGNATYLDKGAYMVLEQPAYSGDSARNPSELQDQAMMYTYLNSASKPKWSTMTVTVQDNGGGSYTLSWTAPAGATKYQIKYSDKPIVEWLGFNNDTQTYQYDPVHYTAFFAANNISNNPAPGISGLVQSYTVSGLDPAKNYYFAIKYESASTQTELLICDLNSDGKADITDIQACVNHFLGTQDWGAKADVNQDGKVDVVDVQEVVNTVLAG